MPSRVAAPAQMNRLVPGKYLKRPTDSGRNLDLRTKGTEEPAAVIREPGMNDNGKQGGAPVGQVFR